MQGPGGGEGVECLFGHHDTDPQNAHVWPDNRLLEFKSGQIQTFWGRNQRREACAPPLPGCGDKELFSEGGQGGLGGSRESRLLTFDFPQAKKMGQAIWRTFDWVINPPQRVREGTSTRFVGETGAEQGARLVPFTPLRNPKRARVGKPLARLMN